MIGFNHGKFMCAVFLTFSGNCKEALMFYQTCFGGTLQFETFEKELQDYPQMTVVSGSLVSDSIIIHGSDLVHNEGRIPGNHMAIFVYCPENDIRKELTEKLESNKPDFLIRSYEDDKLIEIVDVFDIRWVLYV